MHVYITCRCYPETKFKHPPKINWDSKLWIKIELISQCSSPYVTICEVSKGQLSIKVKHYDGFVSDVLHAGAVQGQTIQKYNKIQNFDLKFKLVRVHP